MQCAICNVLGHQKKSRNIAQRAIGGGFGPCGNVPAPSPLTALTAAQQLHNHCATIAQLLHNYGATGEKLVAQLL